MQISNRYDGPILAIFMYQVRVSSTQAEKLHADGYLSFEGLIQSPGDIDISAIQNRCVSETSSGELIIVTH